MIITNKMLVENALKAAREGWLVRAARDAGKIAALRYISDTVVDGPDGPTNCKCAVGASLPPDVLERLRAKPGELGCVQDNERMVRQVPWGDYDIQFEEIEFAAALQGAHDRRGHPIDSYGYHGKPFPGTGDIPSVLDALVDIHEGGNGQIAPGLERLQRAIETA